MKHSITKTLYRTTMAVILALSVNTYPCPRWRTVRCHAA